MDYIVFSVTSYTNTRLKHSRSCAPAVAAMSNWVWSWFFLDPPIVWTAYTWPEMIVFDASRSIDTSCMRTKAVPRPTRNIPTWNNKLNIRNWCVMFLAETHREGYLFCTQLFTFLMWQVKLRTGRYFTDCTCCSPVWHCHWSHLIHEWAWECMPNACLHL